MLGAEWRGRLLRDFRGRRRKQEENEAAHGHIHEEGLCVESLVKLDNMHGLVEHGVDKHVADRISEEENRFEVVMTFKDNLILLTVPITRAFSFLPLC